MKTSRKKESFFGRAGLACFVLGEKSVQRCCFCCSVVERGGSHRHCCCCWVGYALDFSTSPIPPPPWLGLFLLPAIRIPVAACVVVCTVVVEIERSNHRRYLDDLWMRVHPDSCFASCVLFRIAICCCPVVSEIENLRRCLFGIRLFITTPHGLE